MKSLYLIITLYLCSTRALRHRPNPTDSQVGRQGNNSNDPHGATILAAIVSENNREHNSTQVTEAANKTGNNA